MGTTNLTFPPPDALDALRRARDLVLDLSIAHEDARLEFERLLEDWGADPYAVRRASDALDDLTVQLDSARAELARLLHGAGETAA